MLGRWNAATRGSLVSILGIVSGGQASLIMGKFTRGKINGEQYFRVFHNIGETLAWVCLHPAARAAWLEFGFLYNGVNNGYLSMPCRTLAERLNISKSASARAIQELITYGFLEETAAASFSKKRWSSEYRMTHLVCDRTKSAPSRAFQSCKNGELKNDLAMPAHSPTRGTHRPTTGTT
jgi:hypothetical protein